MSKTLQLNSLILMPPRRMHIGIHHLSSRCNELQRSWPHQGHASLRTRLRNCWYDSIPRRRSQVGRGLSQGRSRRWYFVVRRWQLALHQHRRQSPHQNFEQHQEHQCSLLASRLHGCSQDAAPRQEKRESVHWVEHSHHQRFLSRWAGHHHLGRHGRCQCLRLCR